MLEKFSIKTRFSILAIVVVISFISFGTYSIYNISSLGVIIETINEHPLKVSNAAQGVYISILKMKEKTELAATEKDPYHLREYLRFMENEDKVLYDNMNIIRDKILGSEGKEIEKETRALIRQWSAERNMVLELATAGSDLKSLQDAIFKSDETIKLLEEKSVQLKEYALNKAQTFYVSSMEQKNSSTTLITVILIAFSTLISIFIFFVIKSLITQIYDLVKVGNKISVGDHEFEEMQIMNNEIGALNMSFKKITDSLGSITDVCNAITKGDYSKDFKVRSDKDVLGKSIEFMKNSLKSFKDESEKRDWMKTGQMQLAEIIQGEKDIGIMSDKILTFVAEYLSAKAGAFYIFSTESNPPSLTLTASYAYNSRKNLSNKFLPGEGIIGQAVLEKKPLIISNIPEDYIKILSGLGEAAPKNTAAIPCVYNDSVTAVFEIASFEPFSEIQLQFLQAVQENIAVSINAAIVTRKMEEYIKKMQQQSEELQVQQEELRQSNEELEEQTRALKESEAKLQMQQEELRVSNEELQERTKELESQKDEIHDKNIHLEKIKTELEKKARELEISSKYKSEFLANMSHELRTPLNSILMLSWILSENKEGNLSKKQMEFSNTIHSSGTDLLNLINEILDLSKIESGKMEISKEKINIIDFFNNIKKGFHQIAESKKIQFDLIIENSLKKEFYSDRQRIDQIVKNLLSNAFKFTKEGSVELRVRNATMTESIHEALAIEVKDTGIGIPEEKLMVIFEAFQQADGTTSRKYGGTGLGLSISRELAKILGGRILVASHIDAGSTFTLIIPIGNSAVEKQKEPEPVEAPEPIKETIPEKQSEENGKKYEPDIIEKLDYDVLIIEDDTTFANNLKEVAEENGLRAVIASDGEEGLKIIFASKPRAVILDIGLPKLDGIEVLKRLKENTETKDIPVHVVSGKETEEQSIRNGAVNFFKKPVSVKQLNELFIKMEKVLDVGLKKLLIVEDDDTQRKSIGELIEGKDILIRDTDSGEKAYEMLLNERFDCIILDLGIKDISGFELIERINKDDRISKCPIIIYTGKDLTNEEDMILNKYAKTIIIKGAKSPERLLAETTLFLHRIGTDLNEKRRVILKNLQTENNSVLKNKNVLIVDDDIRNIFALSSVLEENGIIVTAARNGKEGLEKLEKSEKIDLIIMDIMMPEMDGYEATIEIRKNIKYRNLPIIALTAKAMKGDKEKCIEAGANDYLAKPVDTEKLISLLKVWLYK